MKFSFLSWTVSCNITNGQQSIKVEWPGKTENIGNEFCSNSKTNSGQSTNQQLPKEQKNIFNQKLFVIDIHKNSLKPVNLLERKKIRKSKQFTARESSFKSFSEIRKSRTFFLSIPFKYN